jgi:hypothetical protein
MNAIASGSLCVLDQGVLKTLSVPLAVVVRNELGQRSSEVRFAQQNHSVKTLLVDRPQKLLCVRTRIRGMIRRLRDPNPGLVQTVAHGRVPIRIAIVDQHALE